MSDEVIDAGTPVEAVTETEQTEILDEGTAPEVSEDETQEKPPEKSFSQAEVDALVQKRLQKEERKISRRIEQSYQDQAAARARELEPDRNSFNSDDEFVSAQIEHLAEKKAEEKIAQREARKNQETVHDAFQEKIEKASEKYPDFKQVVANQDLRISDAMAEYIQESKNGTDVAYYLGSNPSISAKISSLSPIKAAMELTSIEFELNSKPHVKVSTIPAPISPVGARGSSTPTLANSDFAQYKAERAKQGARWAK
tara:strand:- start:1313 stop:2080 length:768 start_codon:yes stop_codon:yes gene_type:complete